MKKLISLSSFMLAALVGCTSDDIVEQQSAVNYEKRISVTAEDLIPEAGTRTSYTENGTGYAFAWSAGDALGIFPENGRQTEFPIKNGYDTNTAIFDGGDWALKPNAKYAAYYPVNYKLDLDATAIPVDYTGQVQDGSGTTAHLGKYDFMATTFNQVDAKGNVNFQLKHLAALCVLK